MKIEANAEQDKKVAEERGNEIKVHVLNIF